MCVPVETTTRAFVSSKLQNGGRDPNCVCLADCPMLKWPADPDVFCHLCVTSGCGLASRVLCESVDLRHPASVGMLAMESGAFPKWSELRNEGSSEAPEPRSQRKPPLIQQSKIPLVTNTRFAQRNGRGREGERADEKTVKRNKTRVGHGWLMISRFCLMIT